MRMVFSGLMAASLALGLAGCSDNKSSVTQFETKGLVAPVDYCPGDPRRFADARKIADIDEGNGCFVHDAYEVTSIGGVALNTSQTLNCGVVTTAASWLQNTVQPDVSEPHLSQ